MVWAVDYLTASTRALLDGGEPAVSGDLSGYADGASVNSWATQAVTWAVQEGLISGVGNNTLNPQGQASRAQVATILTRFIENGLW